MAETNLAQSVEAVGVACSYDTNVKYLLADKQVLSRILKYSVSEFKDMSIGEIINCIGDDIEIGSRPIDAGLTNLGRISGGNTEDNIPGEGKIFFDIRFSAYSKKAEIKILINVEAQKSSDPEKLGYHLENRIMFYMARMISAQKQTEFYHSDYDSLKKVRSIWICMDSRKDNDCIEELYMDRKTVYGKRDNPFMPDLMKGIVIHIRSGNNIKESQNVLISMLEELLSQMGADEKKQILAEKYGMIMTAELEGRLKTMCNLSENIIDMGIEKGIEQGIEKGIEQGIEQGIERGIEQERLNAIRRMLKANAAKEQIISFGYTEEELIKAQE